MSATEELSTREFFSNALDNALPDRMSWVVIINTISRHDGHDVVALVGPVVAINQTIFQALALQIPRLDAPNRESFDILNANPFHDRDCSRAITAMSMIQQLFHQRRISAKLLNESDKTSESNGIISPYLYQVVRGVVVDSNQRMIPTMVCLGAFVKDRWAAGEFFVGL